MIISLQPEKHDLLVHIARLYYLKNLTHQQIADKLGLSRVKVTRLLQEAVQAGLVEFKIANPINNNFELQEQLEQYFNIERAIITPTGQNEQETRELLGQAAGELITEKIKPNTKIGLGWGKTLSAMVPYLKNVKMKNIEVVSMTGGLAANSKQPNPYDVASSVATKIGAEVRYMLAPAVVADSRIKELLAAEGHIAEISALWQQLDCCIMSIGSLSTNSGIFYAFPDPAAEVEKIRQAGGVGDLLAQPLNIEGQFISPELAERTMSIGFDCIKKIPLVVGVAGGEDKVQSIIGALNSGYLTTIITDEATAKNILSMILEPEALMDK